MKTKRDNFKQFTHTNEIIPGNDPEWSTVDVANLPREAYADMGDDENPKTWLYPHHYVFSSSRADVHGKPAIGKMLIHKTQMMAAYKKALSDKAKPEVIEHFEKHWRAVDPDKDGVYLVPEVGSNQPMQSVKAPAYAFRHAAPLHLAPGDASSTSGGAALSIVALCGKPLEHPVWGKIVQDLSGMTHKERILVDYNHEPGELLGYVDKFDVSGNVLQLSGALVLQQTHKRTDEIIANMSAGMPYEASIFFAPSTPDDVTVEDLPEGVSDLVNGEVVTGPIRIFRKWPLRGVAVCPYGLDRNTSSFAQGGGKMSAEVSFSVTTKEQETNEMKKAEMLAAIHNIFGAEAGTKDAELVELLGKLVKLEEGEAAKESEEEKPESEESPAAEQAAVEPKPEEEAGCETAEMKQAATLRKYVDAFGAADGAEYLLAGKSFEQASVAHIAKLREENEKIKASAGKTPVAFDAEKGKQAGSLPASEQAKLDEYAKRFGLSGDRAADLAKRRAEYDQKIKSVEQ